MTKEKNTAQTSTLYKNVLEWLGIGAVIGLLYVTGLHTEVIGTMQRAMLWTGLFDAEVEEITTTDGPYLSEAAYSFSLVSPQGDRIKLEEFKGKTLFINVWASWCPPCVAEMPTIESLYQEVSSHSDAEVAFLMISLDQEQAKADEFMNNKAYSMPHYFPASGLPQVFQSPYIPTTFVISKEGQIVYKKEGIADYSSKAFSDWLMGLGS